MIGQIGNQTRPLATTTQDHQKSWTRNLVEETVSNIAWDVTSPAHDTLEGLATQDPKLIGYGLGKTAAVGALGVVVKEGAPVVVEKLVEKVPVLGKDVRQLAGKALSRAKAVFEGATEQAKRLLQAEIQFSEGTLGANLGNLRLRLPPKPVPAGKPMTRAQRWMELATESNSRLPKEVVDFVVRHKGKRVAKRFGLELGHKPNKPASQGHDFREAIPKTAADHRGIQHTFLKERRTGTTISLPKTRRRGKLRLPPPGALPD